MNKIEKLIECKKLQTELGKKIAELSKEIRDSCDNSCVNWEKHEIYSSGTYYDPAYTHCFRKCDVCGKYEDLGTKGHAWYS